MSLREAISSVKATFGVVALTVAVAVGVTVMNLFFLDIFVRGFDYA